MGNVTAESVGAVEVEAPADLVECPETVRLANMLAGFGIEVRNIEARLVVGGQPRGVYYPCVAFPTSGEAVAFLPELARLVGSLPRRQRRRLYLVALSRDPGGPGALVYFPGLPTLPREPRQ